ncbi:FtsX-like permease family protein [Candidatus Enterococcus murrayae]|uniref:ABC transporter permease n=1 Tax=Candidatus Enterococcus murrayae TaxID=2815321 RepID=A0ABS3HN18_9ENTE|nr:ABC transporter permease [Enterococcus sp. MJM16]MBO0454851.1 ABC transporter permease [Enterococcus sp. MJM16]
MLRKTFRDLRKNWISFLSVFLMSFICLFIFTGIFHFGQQMGITGKQFSKNSHLADSTLTVANFNEPKEAQTKKLSSVKQFAHRSVGRYQNEQFSLTILSFDHSYTSKPQVIRGAKLSDQAGIWLDEDFFQANEQQLGDYFSIDNQRYEILGTVRQPEFIYHTENKDQPLPNHKKSGYAYLSEQYFDQLPIYPSHQLLLKTNKDSNIPWLENELSDIWGDEYLQLTETNNGSGLSIFLDRVTQVQRLAFLFSSLFLLLTLITIEATMRRFVKQQQIAILKAQGFSGWSILLHYLSFSMIVTFFGSVLGCFLGPKLLSPALLSAIGKQFSVPKWLEVQTTLGYAIVAVITFLSMLITLIPVLPLVNQLPAVIMQKQSTQRFKRVWLEQTRLWSYLPFSLQWTLRDIQRNIRRAVLGIFGAMGCMLLLIAALGIKDSINFSLDSVFNDTYHYQEKVSFKRPMSAQDRHSTVQHLTSDYQWMEQQSVKLLKGSKEQTVQATIVSNGRQLNLPEIELKNLTANQVALSEALAKDLNVTAEETLYIKLQQQILPVSIKKLLPISSPQGIFLSQRTWENLKQPFEPQSLLLKEKNQLAPSPLIAGRSEKLQQFKDSQALIEGILTIVSLLILAALTLGITIMMNCHLLIFSERFIEFATLKVLGFTKWEVLSLSFLETTLLTLLGWLLGIPAGWLFLNTYVALLSTGQQQYLPHLSFQSLMLASLVLFACMLLVQAYLNNRINRIDFATALKPAE